MEEVRKVPPLSTSPSNSVYSSPLHGVTGPSTSGTSDMSRPPPQYGTDGRAIGNVLASPPLRICHVTMMLSGPPTMKQPGHNSMAPSENVMRTPFSVILSSRSSQLSSWAAAASAGAVQVGHARNVGEGSAICNP